MKDMKKVTVVLPSDLLERATMATGKGITATIREALEAMVAVHAFEGMRRLRSTSTGFGEIRLGFTEAVGQVANLRGVVNPAGQLQRPAESLRHSASTDSN
jgi:hypothetical protein